MKPEPCTYRPTKADLIEVVEADVKSCEAYLAEARRRLQLYQNEVDAWEEDLTKAKGRLAELKAS
jgi:hypothetical protein